MSAFQTTTIERTKDRRLRIPWGKKGIPLKNSSLFSSAKHSDEWHHSIDATAGVLHPSDSKFPYGFLRNHTDAYLKKKNKITQADTDVRLAILITSHEARDIAVAAAAHAMTAGSLRALLPAHLNVMQGNYWGLKTWLQCLIAANDGNPASVTDLEALWARKLLPFATQGLRATEWYLVGMCRALREMSIQNMDVLPEFSVLMRRAIVDYSTQLEGMRLRCQWAAAYESVLWMMELARTSTAVSPLGHLLPEHALDAQFPTWRLWTHWQPNIDRIKLIASSKNENLAAISDLIALEGPDVITGVESTLREGLVARFGGAKTLVRWRGIIIEAPDCTKKSLRDVIERVARALDGTIAAVGAGSQDLFELFRYFMITKPVTTDSLDIFEATFKIPYTRENDIYNTVREIHNYRNQLGGQHILALQHLVSVFKDHNARDLRALFLQDWLRSGIENGLRDCQKVVQMHIDKALSWTRLALEYHAFCTILKESEHFSPLAYKTMKNPSQWPSQEEIKAVIEIYDAAQAQRLQNVQKPPRTAAVGITTHESTKQTKQVAMPSYLVGEDESTRHPLEEHIEAYCVDRVLGGSAISHSTQRTMAALLHVWESTSKPQIDVERRDLAIIVSRDAGKDFILRCRCLAEIATGKQMLESEIFVKDLLNILRKSESELSEAIIDFTDLLVARKAWTQCWKDLLYTWLERQCQAGLFKGQTVLEHSSQTMNTAQWLSFMERIETLFADVPFSSSTHRTIPPVLQPALLDHKAQMSKYADTLTRLEAVLGENLSPVQCFLTCHSWAKTLIDILECLQKAEGKPVEVLMQRIVGKLRADKRNDLKIKESLLDLAKASSETLEACYRIWDANQGWLDIPGLPADVPVEGSTVLLNRSSVVKARWKQNAKSTRPSQPDRKALATPSAETKSSSRRDVPPSVVEIMVAGWIQSDDVDERDKTAIASIAGLLGVCVEAQSSHTWTVKLTEAMAFWEGIENEILKEAARLESLQKALKVKDPKGTALLLKELGVPNNSLLDEEILNLPADIINVVERVGEAEIEISFPLTAFTDLQRGALGIPRGANSLLLRLTIHNVDETPLSFCVHFNNDKDFNSLEHTPWICSTDSRPPYENVCKTPQTAFVWQLNRILHTRLKIGNISIVDLHKLVKKKTEQMGHLCISCETSHNAPKAQLRRATPCNVLSCARLWYQLPLDVRIPEIRTDIFAVDAMLTSVYAASMSGRTELLPGCPIYGNEVVHEILNSLPSLTVLSHAVNISAVLQSYHKDAEKLISWACVHHRGYIATARGLCKIPTMPAGTHQFVLANASPRLENDFVSKLPRSNVKTSVLFHGTTFDRLPAILAQGLKVYSGTSLQRTGAAHGKGIYMAEEPATSLTYAPAAVSWRNSGLTNMRLLLGCEVVGVGRSASPGIHVVTDEKSIMVRYIFFLTSQATVPIANHLVPPMASGMSALRTGAV